MSADERDSPRPERVPARRTGGVQFIPRPAVWSPGDAASWNAVGQMSAIAVAEAVVAAQVHQPRAPTMLWGARPSAVLVALVDGARGAEVLLTKRTLDLRHHAGEISFPGGRIDDGEDVVAAALREADEEVGLGAQFVRVAGRLSALSTVVSRSFIIPVVATLNSRPLLVAHDREVARIMWVPLVELANAECHREERWGDASLARQMDFFELDDETIWGVTARILRELLDVIYGPPAARTTP